MFYILNCISNHPRKHNHGWMKAFNKPCGYNLVAIVCVVQLGLTLTVISISKKHTAITVSCLRPIMIGTPKWSMKIKINPEISRINRIFYRSQASPLPDGSDLLDLSNCFENFVRKYIDQGYLTKCCSWVQLSPTHVLSIILIPLPQYNLGE